MRGPTSSLPRCSRRTCTPPPTTPQPWASTTTGQTPPLPRAEPTTAETCPPVSHEAVAMVTGPALSTGPLFDDPPPLPFPSFSSCPISLLTLEPSVSHGAGGCSSGTFHPTVLTSPPPTLEERSLSLNTPVRLCWAGWRFHSLRFRGSFGLGDTDTAGPESLTVRSLSA